MVSRSVIGCTNRSTYNPNIQFYQIPSEKKNKPLHKQWLHNVCRAVQVPKDKSFYICSNHFKEDNFQRDLQVSSSIFVKLFLSCLSFLEIANVNSHKYS